MASSYDITINFTNKGDRKNNAYCECYVLDVLVVVTLLFQRLPKHNSVTLAC